MTDLPDDSMNQFDVPASPDLGSPSAAAARSYVHDVVTIGEAMVLLVAEQSGALDRVETFRKRTAGAETNVAVGLARLGLRVGWLSRLGEDSWGRYLERVFASEGIDCSRVLRDPDARTGLMLKERVLDGSDPAIEYHRRGSAASRLAPGDLDEAFTAGARHLHATGVAAGVSGSSRATVALAIERMRALGRTVSFDPNLRPALWPSRPAMVDTLNALALRCDWVLPGLEEGRILTGRDSPEDIAAFYLDHGVGFVVVKLGADGAYWASRDRAGASREGRVPGVPVARVVDTVGAGDGFAVGVVSALLEGASFESAVVRGAWIGARAVQVRGDTEGLPTRAQLDAEGPRFERRVDGAGRELAEG